MAEKSVHAPAREVRRQEEWRHVEVRVLLVWNVWPSMGRATSYISSGVVFGQKRCCRKILLAMRCLDGDGYFPRVLECR